MIFSKSNRQASITILDDTPRVAAGKVSEISLKDYHIMLCSTNGAQEKRERSVV
jgi:hypothetical protein